MLAASSLESVAPAQYRLTGAVTVANAAALRRQGLGAFAAERGEFTIDLAAVAPIDSAGLALLIDWLAAAREHGAHLSYLHLPLPARTLARLSDVESLLESPA
ncbi:MAG: STAS domain-containing protein [Steroidobacteraceae bacterium]|jgi:phospholipid transport system transporter-binding protein